MTEEPAPDADLVPLVKMEVDQLLAAEVARLTAENVALKSTCRAHIAENIALTAERDALREAADSLALKLQAYVDMTGNTLGTGALKRYAALNNSTPRDETAV